MISMNAENWQAHIEVRIFIIYMPKSVKKTTENKPVVHAESSEVKLLRILQQYRKFSRIYSENKHKYAITY